MTAQSRGGFGGNTSNNQKNDACNMIGVSNGRVTILMEVDKSKKKTVECESKKEGGKIEKLIDASSILRKSKSQLLKDGDKPQGIPYYVRLPYPHFSKNKETVKCPENKHCKVIELRTRKVLKPVSLERLMKWIVKMKLKMSKKKKIKMTRECLLNQSGNIHLDLGIDTSSLMT